MLKKYVIERDVPGIGGMSSGDLGGAAATSNAALAKIEGVQWQHSYVTADKTFCIYLAESEDQIRAHAKLSGFPANRITEVRSMLEPVTEYVCASAGKASRAA